jgi:teichuronic acid biosynthesis glycosyltransferase TuaG
MSLVSIVTPVFNASKYLEEVYVSLQQQTHTDWEWLVTDDFSTDNSLSILQGISSRDSRVRVFQNDQNSGPSVSRNRGIMESRGEYIAFLDADDTWLPNKLENQLKFMISKNVVFSCHSYEIVDEAGSFIKKVNVPLKVGLKELSSFNPLATSFIMVKKDILTNLLFDPSLKRRQDWVFWFHLAKRNYVCMSLPEILGRYRKDSINSISKNKLHMAVIQWNMYRTYFKQDFFKSALSFLRYAYHGVSKHYLK